MGVEFRWKTVQKIQKKNVGLKKYKHETFLQTYRNNKKREPARKKNTYKNMGIKIQVAPEQCWIDTNSVFFGFLTTVNPTQEKQTDVHKNKSINK